MIDGRAPCRCPNYSPANTNYDETHDICICQTCFGYAPVGENDPRRALRRNFFPSDYTGYLPPGARRNLPPNAVTIPACECSKPELGDRDVLRETVSCKRCGNAITIESLRFRFGKCIARFSARPMISITIESLRFRFEEA